MINNKVIPKVGQVWAIPSRDNVTLKSFEDNYVMTSDNRAIFINDLNMHFTFKPANDLEWLAISDLYKEPLNSELYYSKLKGIIISSKFKTPYYYLGADIINKSNELFGEDVNIDKMETLTSVYDPNDEGLNQAVSEFCELMGDRIMGTVKKPEDSRAINGSNVAESKPVYTQAMADNGELPVTGMLSCVDFLGGNIFVDATMNYISDSGFAFTDNQTGKEVFVGTLDRSIVKFREFKPKTDQEKLVDDLARLLKLKFYRNNDDETFKGEAEFLMEHFNITRK